MLCALKVPSPYMVLLLVWESCSYILKNRKIVKRNTAQKVGGLVYFFFCCMLKFFFASLCSFTCLQAVYQLSGPED